MIIDLGAVRLKGEPLNIEADFTEKELGIGSRIAVLEKPAHSYFRIEAMDELARVSGEVEVDLSLTCCRCASGFPLHLEKAFSLDYVPDSRHMSSARTVSTCR